MTGRLCHRVILRTHTVSGELLDRLMRFEG